MLAPSGKEEGTSKCTFQKVKYRTSGQQVGTYQLHYVPGNDIPVDIRMRVYYMRIVA